MAHRSACDLLSIVGVAVVVAGTLVACGGSDDAASAAGLAAAASAPASGASGVATAASAPAGGASGVAAAASAPAGGASGVAAAASAPTVAVTAVGTAVGPIAAFAVPAAGGSLASADGRLTVDVPAGALPATTRLSIQAVTNEAPGGRGMGYRLHPEGLTFAAPVRLTFRYADSDIAGSEALALRIAYQDEQRRWNWVKQRSLDEAAGTISVQTTHFSAWSMLVGYQLSPAVRQVALGQAVDFEVIACATKPTGNDELAELAYFCLPEPDFFVVQRWQANGIDGGTLEFGQIASVSPGTARYVAPNAVPTKPGTHPVNIEARARDESGRTTLLTASVSLLAFPPLRGTITSTTRVESPNVLTMTHSTTAHVQFHHDLETNLYFATWGTVTSHIDSVSPTCEYHIAWSGSINRTDPTTGARDGYIGMQEDGRYTADAMILAPHTGTTSCTSDGRVEPLTVQQAGALWFPAPPAMGPGAVELRRKADGVLDEFLVWSPGPGRETTVRWRLTPVP